jgi:hypothetical protein
LLIKEFINTLLLQSLKYWRYNAYYNRDVTVFSILVEKGIQKTTLVTTALADYNKAPVTGARQISDTSVNRPG